MKERSRGTPLIDMLKGYQPCRGRFHMPGHKASPDFCRTFPGAASDITELPFSDDLLDEKGCIAEAEGVKNAAVMWPERIAVSGTQVTPGGAVEITRILGREEALRRIDVALAKLG